MDRQAAKDDAYSTESIDTFLKENPNAVGAMVLATVGTLFQFSVNASDLDVKMQIIPALTILVLSFFWGIRLFLVNQIRNGMMFMLVAVIPIGLYWVGNEPKLNLLVYESRIEGSRLPVAAVKVTLKDQYNRLYEIYTSKDGWAKTRFADAGRIEVSVCKAGNTFELERGPNEREIKVRKEECD